MSAKKEIKNPLQKYIDQINSLDVFNDDDKAKDLNESTVTPNNLTSDSKQVKSKIVNLSHITKAKEDLFLLMKELKIKKKIS